MLNIRQAQKEDLEKYLYWANDPLVREWSYNPNAIRLYDHTAWFERKLQDPDCHLYVFQKEQGECIGQVRIEIEPDHEAVIGISIYRCQLQGPGTWRADAGTGRGCFSPSTSQSPHQCVS